MRRNQNVRSAIVLAVLLAEMLLVLGTAYGQGVSVALTPQTQRVVPGSLVHMDITLVEAGSPINAFDAYVGFDPVALTPLPRVPIEDQIGLLMTGACPDWFHRFGAGNETPVDTVTVSLLCAGVSVTGPGQIYTLQFQASMTPQVTYVRLLPGLRFYNEGLYVTPVFATDAIIGIGMDPPTSVEPGMIPEILDLQVAPNPVRGDAVITISSDRHGAQGLIVTDLLGRVVRRFDDTVTTPGIRAIAWDGRDPSGHRLPSGIYFVTLDVAGRAVTKRVLLVR